MQVILIGDHHQLPPVVKNPAFQKYARLDQPLFTRFVRLGVPYVELSAQGRARPGLAALYAWRYRALGNLPHVSALPAFQAPNAGFAYDYQFVDVPPQRGPGESAPSPHFFQNLDEAEMTVRVYMLMRLLGYPAASIAMLTTYNGQKALLEDAVARHCARHPLFGAPAKIATVDKFQGQQADYVLLSLVRTRRVGHLRDVRRLVVAMSRARLGLYVFGCRGLFGDCLELAPAMRQLLARPPALALLLGERYGRPGSLVARGAEAAGPAGIAAMPGGVLVTSLMQMDAVVQSVLQHVAAEAEAAAAAAAAIAAASAAADDAAATPDAAMADAAADDVAAAPDAAMADAAAGPSPAAAVTAGEVAVVLHATTPAPQSGADGSAAERDQVEDGSGDARGLDPGGAR